MNTQLELRFTARLIQSSRKLPQSLLIKATSRLEVVAIKTRQQPQVDNCLKPVANGENELAVRYELAEPVSKMGPHAGSQQHSCSMVVAPTEPAAKDQDMVVVKVMGRASAGVRYQVVNMDSAGVGAGLAQTVVCFIVAVQPEAGQDEGLYGCVHQIKSPKVFFQADFKFKHVGN